MIKTKRIVENQLDINLLIPRRYVRYAVLAVFLPLTFRTFQDFPGMAPIKELWQVVAFMFLCFPFLFWKIRSGWRFSTFELYILAIMSVMPMLSGIAAWREFGQPIIYGVLAQRAIILGTGALAVMYALRRNLISLDEIEQTFLILGWGTLSLYFFSELFLDPSIFAQYGEGLVTPGNIEESEFKFRTEFVVFGFMYYAFIGLRRKSLKHYAMASLFLGYIVLMQGGRSLIVSLLAAFIFFAYRWSSAPRLLLLVPKMLMAAILFVVLLYVAKPDYIVDLSSKFSDAFTVVLSGETTSDVSANARIFESALALPYILKNWLLGSGAISNQWHGGYEGVLGGYFYPADIGIVGVVYMYGLFGLLLFSIQFFFAIRFSRHIPVAIAKLPFVDAIKGFLLYYAVHSLVTGRFAHYCEVSFVFIALLCVYQLKSAQVRLSEDL